MKTDIKSFFEFHKAVCDNDLVFMFGTGISAALTGKRYSWYKWISDGISSLKDLALAKQLNDELDADSSADHLISVVGKVISAAKADGTYSSWMHDSFEMAEIINADLADTLKKLAIFNDIFATTNYDLLLERATGLKSISYKQPDQAIEMIKSGQSGSVLHIHGIYDSVRGIDNIVADKEQYEAVLNDQGAQFIQQILGTRTLVFIGCGKTTEDMNVSQFVEFARKYLKMDQDYYFLHNSSSPVEGLPENIHPVPYGDDYADLPVFLEDVAQERIRKRITNIRCIGRTIYTDSQTDTYGLSEYHFSKESIAFCGRKYELGLLKSFLEKDSFIQWWAVTGQAGAGKSRLAYELMKIAPSGWFAFFLNVAASSIEDFVPFSDTLIIIDYVLGNENRVSSIATELIRVFLSSNPRFKLRILFLERENLTIAGTWYHNLEQSFKYDDRRYFVDAEYHPNPSVSGHDFLNIEDLEESAVVELIGNICGNYGLPADVYRDRELKEEYARKYEQLRFRPLYLQIFVQAWVENSQTNIDYRNYKELLTSVLNREIDHLRGNVCDDMHSLSSLLKLLVRAAVTPLNTESMSEEYIEEWEVIKGHVQAHTIPGFRRKEYLNSVVKDSTQSVNEYDGIIDPKYPDLIKEILFINCVDDYKTFGSELWKNNPSDYSVFLYRCLVDFPDETELIKYILSETYDKQNSYALRSRIALLHHEIITSSDDPENINAAIDREYEFWKGVDESNCEFRTIRLNGLYAALRMYLGWSRKEAFTVLDDIVLSEDPDCRLTNNKIEMLLETAEYFTHWGSYEASEQVLSKLTKINKREQKADLKKEALHCINIAGVIPLRQALGQTDKEWEKVQDLLEELKNHCDLTDDAEVEIYTAAILEILKLAQTRFAGGPACDIFYRLQDYAEDWGDTAEIAFNDQIHFNYLYGKLIHTENVSIASTLGLGDSSYAVEMIDVYIKEVCGNIMIRDFSGLLIGAYALKVGFDDDVKDSDVKGYISLAEQLIEEYPDSELLVEKYIDLLSNAFEYQYKKRVTKEYVEKCYSLVLRFPEEYGVLNNFFVLLKNSEGKADWYQYTRQKSIVNGLIRNSLQQYLFPPEDDIEEPYVRAYKKIGRNEPCPCGSGKKFKQCCLGKGIYD